MAGSKGWRVKTARPDDLVHPDEFYTEEEAERYDKRSVIRKTQRELTLRALELADFPAGAKILDIGCGTGISMQTLAENGFEAQGIDISKPMLAVAKRKGLKVKFGDIKKMPGKGEFDGIISISVIQWLKNKDEMKAAAKECLRILSEGGKAVFQFYPASEEHMVQAAKAFADAGFKEVKLAIDSPENSRKRKIFLIACK
ncbi:MAG: class I SAM-dependent methyltransferase [Candidatus Micrarchaeota archaeon]